MTEAIEDVGTNALAPDPAPEIVETPEITQVPETAETEIPETEVVAEAEPEVPVEKVHGNKGKIPWQTHRINEETNKRKLLEAELEQERREKAEALALLERQGGDKPAPQPTNLSDADIEARVEALAARKLFNADCDAVAQAWEADAKGDFKSRLGILNDAGVLSDKNNDFLLDIFAVDKANAHKILDSLAQNPDLAFDMTKMDSRRRIAALTRMTMTETKPAAPAPVVRSGVSKVPPPKPVVEAVSDGGGEMDLSNEKLSDAEWSALFNKKYGRKKSA